MATPTRTIGPLHLEDLEPHRFEDLIRQLIYDFRNWREIEATGRSGSDDGFDARGFEIVENPEETESSENSNEGERIEGYAADRVWLVQCKREKAISPKKIIKYLADIPESERQSIYGIIFVGACDFSKASRDVFRAKAREFGFAEAYLWGKGEIEDMLFQPKNDYLLFAYFGVSLQIRRRSLKAEVRSKLATKRKVIRILTSHESQFVLLRDASDDRYPYLDQDKTKPRIERGRWALWHYEGCFYDGLHFKTHRQFAFIDDNRQHWDHAETMDDAVARDFQNPWYDDSKRDEDTNNCDVVRQLWEGFPEANRAWFEVTHVLPYENILDIDEKGDDWCESPHIYTADFRTRTGPFKYALLNLIPLRSESIVPDEGMRIERFPRMKKIE